MWIEEFGSVRFDSVCLCSNGALHNSVLFCTVMSHVMYHVTSSTIISLKMEVGNRVHRQHVRRTKMYLAKRRKIRRRIQIVILLLLQTLSTRRVWRHPRETWWSRVAMVNLDDWPNEMFAANLRMSRETFFWLCSELEPHIRKKTTNYRKAVPVSVRLAITLWRLATNVEYRTLGHLFGVGLSTTGNIVRSCCRAIKEHLMPRYVKMPKDQQFREILSGFENVWGFPHCAGAIDGTHIPIIAPSEDHADYFNRYFLVYFDYNHHII